MCTFESNRIGIVWAGWGVPRARWRRWRSFALLRMTRSTRDEAGGKSRRSFLWFARRRLRGSGCVVRRLGGLLLLRKTVRYAFRDEELGLSTANRFRSACGLVGRFEQPLEWFGPSGR